jgi:hypothetical protein
LIGLLSPDRAISLEKSNIIQLERGRAMTNDQGMNQSMVHAGRLGELTKALAAILEGVQEVQEPRPLIYSAVFLNAEMAVEVDRLEEAIRGWGRGCEKKSDVAPITENNN